MPSYSRKRRVGGRIDQLLRGAETAFACGFSREGGPKLDVERAHRSLLPCTVTTVRGGRLPALDRAVRPDVRARQCGHRPTGKFSYAAMVTQALLPLLRKILEAAGTPQARSHSVFHCDIGLPGRAPMAGTKRANGACLRDVRSAVGYIEVPREALENKFEGGLASTRRSSYGP